MGPVCYAWDAMGEAGHVHARSRGRRRSFVGCAGNLYGRACVYQALAFFLTFFTVENDWWSAMPFRPSDRGVAVYLDGVDLGGRLLLCVHRFLRLRPSAGGPTCGKGRDAWARSEKYWFFLVSWVQAANRFGSGFRKKN